MRKGTRLWLPAGLLLAAVALLLCPASAAAQVKCGDVAGNCANQVCPDLHDSAGNVVGTATCMPTGPGKKCECVYTKSDASCAIDQQTRRCKKMKCPDKYYRSRDDATNQRNPITANCEAVGNPPTCQCAYRFK